MGRWVDLHVWPDWRSAEAFEKSCRRQDDWDSKAVSADAPNFAERIRGYEVRYVFDHDSGMSSDQQREIALRCRHTHSRMFDA